MTGNRQQFGLRPVPQPEAAEEEQPEFEIAETPSPAEHPSTLFERLRARESRPPATALEFRQIEQGLRQRVRRRHEGIRLPWRQLVLLPAVFLGLLSFFQPQPVNRTFQWLLYGLIAISMAVSIFWGRWRPRE
ncbi:MAG TPA: hypothetical protein VHE09_05215 [Rhizomicrobium sp.]|nr:hypothetical protein [Rhizomicrobium sp.]HWA04855.1 hypothetical protein [Rhizomicrobium sp.]